MTDGQIRGIEPGALWRCKRQGESHRRVRIQYIIEDSVGVERLYHGSSHRRMMKIATLLHDYRYVRTDPVPAEEL